MAKNSHLEDLQAIGPLQVLRADLDEDGSFDEAVAGCDYAFLVAAPMNLKSEILRCINGLKITATCTANFQFTEFCDGRKS